MTDNNSARRHAAQFALSTHALAKGDVMDTIETGVIDLLADLRHLCDAHALCFGDLDRMAYGHYLEERETDKNQLALEIE